MSKKKKSKPNGINEEDNLKPKGISEETWSRCAQLPEFYDLANILDIFSDADKVARKTRRMVQRKLGKDCENPAVIESYAFLRGLEHNINESFEEGVNEAIHVNQTPKYVCVCSEPKVILGSANHYAETSYYEPISDDLAEDFARIDSKGIIRKIKNGGLHKS
jgi:hypothetical protein